MPSSAGRRGTFTVRTLTSRPARRGGGSGRPAAGYDQEGTPDPQAARIVFFQRFDPRPEQFSLERQARLQPRGDKPARHDAHRLAHRLPLLPRGGGRHRTGRLGQTSLPMNYFRRPQFFDFSFASPYYAYTYDMENVPFYNTKKPIIRMTYLESGQKRFRRRTSISCTRRIFRPRRVQRRLQGAGNARQYIWSRTKNHNLSVAFSHTGKRYSVHAAYYNNHIEQQENGGVVGRGPSPIRRSRCLRACP